VLDLPHLLQLERQLLVKKRVARGLYRHYKGGLYVVLGVGMDSETRGDVAVYYSLSHQGLRVRPLGMFCESVRPDRGDDAPVAAPGDPRGVPRFRRVLPPGDLAGVLFDLVGAGASALRALRSIL
jgi:hypothetical protein